jgi:hypothetical protein
MSSRWLISQLINDGVPICQKSCHFADPVTIWQYQMADTLKFVLILTSYKRNILVCLLLHFSSIDDFGGNDA